MGISFDCLVHSPGLGLWGTMGVWVKCFFLNSTRFGVWVTYMKGTCTSAIFWVPTPWGLGETSKFNFLNMVMWHIKFKGMSSRPGYTENFNLWSNWWTWDGVKESIIIIFLRESWDWRWRAIECVLVSIKLQLIDVTNSPGYDGTCLWTNDFQMFTIRKMSMAYFISCIDT